MTAKNKPEAGEPKKAERKFSKAQLLKCERYREQQDLLQALLSDKQVYTLEEVEKKCKEFLERKM